MHTLFKTTEYAETKRVHVETCNELTNLTSFGNISIEGLFYPMFKYSSIDIDVTARVYAICIASREDTF